MDHETDVTRAQMDETRASLSEKLETLQHRVVDTVQGATDAVAETVGNVRDAVNDTVDNVKDTFDVRLQVTRHPWAMVGGSVALGFLGGYFLLRFSSSRPVAIARSPVAAPANPRITEQPNGDLKNHPPLEEASAKMPVQDVAPGAAESGWLRAVQNRFGAEITKVKGLAIGTVMGVVRDMITQSAPDPMKAGLAEAMDSMTVKLGGAPVRGPVFKDDHRTRAEHREANSSGMVGPRGAAQRSSHATVETAA